MKFNCPVFETNGSSEPTDNDLELNAIPYSSLPPFVWFPLRKERGNWKWSDNFSAVEHFTLLWWHLGTQKHAGRAKQNRPNRRRCKTFGSHFQNKTSKPDQPRFYLNSPGHQSSGRSYFLRCIRPIERTGLHSQLPHITPCVKIIPVAFGLIGCIYNTKIGTALQYFISN